MEEVVVGNRKEVVEAEDVVVPLLSNLAFVRQLRQERSRGEVRSAGVCVEWKSSLSFSWRLSPVTARMISYAFPVASSCPTCGMQHAQSDLQSTCVPIQPLPHSDHHASPSAPCKRRPNGDWYAVTYPFCILLLLLFCDYFPSPVYVCVEVVASLYPTQSALSSSICRHKPLAITTVSLQPPGSGLRVRLFMHPLTHLSSLKLLG
jgi:hypothetical protein